ncbi:MAG: hypothetical protein JW934_13680, partial [Anaerolineae bacterium]|nr:hypothetical protein [Anaerolineae bacterium]
ESRTHQGTVYAPSDGFEDRARHRTRFTPRTKIHPNAYFVKWMTCGWCELPEYCLFASSVVESLADPVNSEV